jgi:hypothetical protein
MSLTPRTDFVEATIKEDGGFVAKVRVHPWYKIDPISAGFFLPRLPAAAAVEQLSELRIKSEPQASPLPEISFL